MRLIDADALNTYDVSPAYGMTVIGLTEDDIENAPTIDAVPVEWMENRKCKPNEAYAIRKMLNEWSEGKRRMSLYVAIELLVSTYTYAQAQEWIRNPIAWALYQVWKEADAERKEE